MFGANIFSVTRQRRMEKCHSQYCSGNWRLMRFGQVGAWGCTERYRGVPKGSRERIIASLNPISVYISTRPRVNLLLNTCLSTHWRYTIWRVLRTKFAICTFAKYLTKFFEMFIAFRNFCNTNNLVGLVKRDHLDTSIEFWTSALTSWIRCWHCK